MEYTARFSLDRNRKNCNFIKFFSILFIYFFFRVCYLLTLWAAMLFNVSIFIPFFFDFGDFWHVEWVCLCTFDVECIDVNLGVCAFGKWVRTESELSNHCWMRSRFQSCTIILPTYFNLSLQTIFLNNSKHQSFQKRYWNLIFFWHQRPIGMWWALEQIVQSG